MLMKRLALVAILGLVLVLGTSAVFATALTPLGTPLTEMTPTNATPALLTGLPVGTTILASESSPYFGSAAFPGPGYNITGNIISAVVQLPNTSGLDFLYQITNDASSLASVTQPEVLDVSNAYTTSVGYLTGSGITGVGAPFVGTGSIVPFGGISRALYATPQTELEFDFTKNGNSALTSLPSFAPGTQSVVFVVQTNASEYTQGLAYSQDGGASNRVAAYVPSGQVVPEPSCVAGLLGLISMAGIGLVFRRKR